jgi:DNA/RNA endonuclease YhcR with UshA esterase domain
MKLKHIGTALLTVTTLLCSAATAQQRNAQVHLRASAYDVKRETTLAGTVLNFSENSLLAPAGAHLSLQTAEGTVDVHLGPGSYLHENHFPIKLGDSIRVLGASVLVKARTVFLARMVQNGRQSIAVRSARGFLLAGYGSRQRLEDGGAQRMREVKPQ